MTNDDASTPQTHPNAQSATATSFSTYDLPSVEALVRVYHAAEGFPVKSTWLQDIKFGNYATWPVLTNTNSNKYCPDSIKTSKGHMT